MNEMPDYKMKSFEFDDLFGKDVKVWVKDPNGNSTGGWGLTLNLRDMARFGFLYLNHGICCVPQKDLVIAIASKFIINPHDRWTLIKEHIIPSVLD